MLLIFISCNQNPKNKIAEKKHSNFSKPNNEICILDSNVRSFKNLTLGMDISELKNLKPTKVFQHFMDIHNSNESKTKFLNIEEPEGVKSFEVTSKYTAFGKKVKNIFVRFYNNKLFLITLKTEENPIFQLKERYNIPDKCISKVSEFDKNWWNLYISNKKTILRCGRCGIWSGLLYCEDPSSHYSIDIEDLKISDIVNKIKPAQNRKILNDF